MIICCDSHNRHCEPPRDLCCADCTEAAHDTFPIRHADGSRCVMQPEEGMFPSAFTVTPRAGQPVVRARLNRERPLR